MIPSNSISVVSREATGPSPFYKFAEFRIGLSVCHECREDMPTDEQLKKMLISEFTSEVVRRLHQLRGEAFFVGNYKSEDPEARLHLLDSLLGIIEYISNPVENE